jgi:hypothetical protein
MGIKVMRFPPHLLLPWESKLRNGISQPILATFTRWNMGLKAINHTFQTHPRTPKLSMKWV